MLVARVVSIRMWRNFYYADGFLRYVDYIIPGSPLLYQTGLAGFRSFFVCAYTGHMYALLYEYTQRLCNLILVQSRACIGEDVTKQMRAAFTKYISPNYLTPRGHLCMGLL